MAPSPASTPGAITIQVGSNRFVGWQNVTITRPCESMPNTWALTASAEFLQGPTLAATRPGQTCLITIGSDLLITGWIDRRSIPIDAHNRQVMLSGRGITRNLVHGAAGLVNDPAIRGGQIQPREHAQCRDHAMQGLWHHRATGGAGPRHGNPASQGPARRIA